MRILVHSILKTLQFTKASISFIIKVGYVLSDETISLGYANLYINMIKGLKEGPLEYKLKMMMSNLNKQVHANEIEQIKEYFIQKKEYEKIKHKTPDQLRWNIKNEHRFVEFYRQWEARKSIELDADGYGFLQKLVEEKKLIIQEVIEDGYNFDNIKSISLESVFNCSLQGADCTKSVLIMNDFYVNTLNLKPEDKFVSAEHHDATNTENSWFHYVASVPNFNVLTETELKVIRESFAIKMSGIKNQLDQWLEICNTSAKRTESIQYFQENIISLLPTVNSFFENEPILKFYHDNKMPDSEFYMYIGEITKAALLNYYHSLMPMTDELRQTLEDKFISEGIYNRRIPVIIISRLKNLTLPLDLKIYENLLMEPQKDPTDLQKRKYIQIND